MTTSTITRKVVESGSEQNDAFDTYTTNTNSQNWSVGVDDSDQSYNIVTGTDVSVNKALSITPSRGISITGAAASSLTTSSGALTLQGAGGVDISGTGVATTIKGTFNVDEAATFDTTVGVSGILTMNTNNKIQFRDSALYINSSADGQLDIDADTTLQLTAPTVDIDASTEVNISNALTVGGNISGTIATATQNSITTMTGLTSTGALASGSIANGFGTINIGTNSLTAGSAIIDNLTVDSNTITATSGALNLTPAVGSAIVLDGTINVDAGVVTGATSITSTSFVGALTGNADTSTKISSITNSDIVQLTETQTLTNKTLTAPKIVDGGFIADANGNEGLVLGTTSSAVNEIKISNAATGNGPTIAAQGDDNNVDFNLNAKGTGVVKFTTNTDRTLALDFDGSSSGADTVFAVNSTEDRTITYPDATDTLVGKATIDTLTNKTLTAPVISTISNTGTLTLPTSTDTLVGKATIDTLTNKTLTAPKIVDGGFIADANGNEGLVLGTTTSAVNEIKISNAATGNGPTIAAQGDDSNVDFNLNAKGTGVVKFTTNTDRTLALDFDGSSSGADTVFAVNSTVDRTITYPDATDTLVGKATTDTLTNKTLTAPVISTITNNSNTLTLPTTTDTIVGRATTDTLTNKTLTVPVIAKISNTGTLTLPTSTDTLVGKATTDTLTNKTLTAPKIIDGGFIADANGNEGLVLGTTTSAVNEIKITNAATGNGPTIAAQGGDSNVDLNLSSKGTGGITMNTSSLTVTSSTTEKPLVQIKNTNSDTENATLRLIKDSTSPADNDELGVIDFYGNSQSFASITATSLDITTGDERGKLDFKVATGTDGTEQSIMTIEGSTTNAAASTVTIEGNLDVKGITTTINTTNTTIKDNLIEINSGATSNSSDSGILIERGSTGNNGFMGWDESEDKFIVGTTTAINTDTGDLTITAADFECAELTATGLSGLTSLSITPGTKTMIHSGSSGQKLSLAQGTYNDATTIGTNANFISAFYLSPPILTATNTVTTTDAATFYIAGPPTSGTNQTITHPYALYINSGTARFASMTTNEQVVTSDRKLKTNIITIDNSLEKINKMRGVYFDWKDKEKYSEKRQIGFIAQEVEEVVPELVSEGDKDTKAVNYAQTVALLLEAVKEQNKIIEELRKDVEELKNNKKRCRIIKK